MYHLFVKPNIRGREIVRLITLYVPLTSDTDAADTIDQLWDALIEYSATLPKGVRPGKHVVGPNSIKWDYAQEVDGRICRHFVYVEPMCVEQAEEDSVVKEEELDDEESDSIPNTSGIASL